MAATTVLITVATAEAEFRYAVPVTTLYTVAEPLSHGFHAQMVARLEGLLGTARLCGGHRRLR